MTATGQCKGDGTSQTTICSPLFVTAITYATTSSGVNTFTTTAQSRIISTSPECVNNGTPGENQTNCAFQLCAPKCFTGCGGSPIILDLDGKGFDLTSAKNGVKFDISGTGAPVQMGWIAQGADNAFLALPGADGLVHNGMQLFGDFTPQPASDHPNGFAALAVYDDPKNGGNGDGVIDSRDAIFASLRLSCPPPVL
jgi:hypothetical protein